MAPRKAGAGTNCIKEDALRALAPDSRSHLLPKDQQVPTGTRSMLATSLLSAEALATAMSSGREGEGRERSRTRAEGKGTRKVADD